MGDALTPAEVEVEVPGAGALPLLLLFLVLLLALFLDFGDLGEGILPTAAGALVSLRDVGLVPPPVSSPPVTLDDSKSSSSTSGLYSNQIYSTEKK